jgi:hypothetical protein
VYNVKAYEARKRGRVTCSHKVGTIASPNEKKIYFDPSLHIDELSTKLTGRRHVPETGGTL